MPDDHSKLVPLLPIPNRTVKRLSADDSADSRVKVGHRQALTARNARLIFDQPGVFFCPFDLCVWLVPGRTAVQKPAWIHAGFLLCDARYEDGEVKRRYRRGETPVSNPTSQPVN